MQGKDIRKPSKLWTHREMGTDTFGMKPGRRGSLIHKLFTLGKNWGHHGINICPVKRQDRDTGKRMGEPVYERDMYLGQRWGTERMLEAARNWDQETESKHMDKEREAKTWGNWKKEGKNNIRWPRNRTVDRKTHAEGDRDWACYKEINGGWSSFPAKQRT